MAWSKEQLKKFRTTNAAKKSKSAKRERAAYAPPKPPPVDAHYVGEAPQAPAVDINRLEERAFRELR